MSQEKLQPHILHNRPNMTMSSMMLSQPAPQFMILPHATQCTMGSMSSMGSMGSMMLSQPNPHFMMLPQYTQCTMGSMMLSQENPTFPQDQEIQLLSHPFNRYNHYYGRHLYPYYNYGRYGYGYGWPYLRSCYPYGYRNYF